MKQVKKFFKKCDLFSVPFSFRYRNNDTFSTFSGGFLSIIFCVIAFLFGINFFIAFCKRKNFSLFFNSINKKEKEGINFDSEQYAIAIRFDCDKKNNEVTNYLKLEVKYKKKILSTKIFQQFHAKKQSILQKRMIINSQI